MCIIGDIGGQSEIIRSGDYASGVYRASLHVPHPSRARVPDLTVPVCWKGLLVSCREGRPLGPSIDVPVVVRRRGIWERKAGES